MERMKLINAKTLADFITENEDVFAYAIEHKDRSALEDVIESIPTAYDIDYILELLKEHAIEFEAFGQCSDYVELSHAIEIVKAGGE